MLNRYKLNPIGKARDILLSFGGEYYVYAVNGLDIDADNENSARNKATKKFPIQIQEILQLPDLS